MTYGRTGPASGSSQRVMRAQVACPSRRMFPVISATFAAVEPSVAAAIVPSITTGTRVTHSTARWSRRRAVDIVAAVDLAAAVMAGILPALILDLGESATVDWRHIVQASIVGAVLTLICLTARNTFDPARIHDFAVAPKALLLRYRHRCVPGLGSCAAVGTRRRQLVAAGTRSGSERAAPSWSLSMRALMSRSSASPRRPLRSPRRHLRRRPYCFATPRLHSRPRSRRALCGPL